MLPPNADYARVLKDALACINSLLVSWRPRRNHRRELEPTKCERRFGRGFSNFEGGFSATVEF